MDETAHIVVAAELTNMAADSGEVPAVLQAVKANLNVQPAQVLADAGSPSGKFVTSEVLNVEGGMLLWCEFWPAGKPDYFKVDQP